MIQRDGIWHEKQSDTNIWVQSAGQEDVMARALGFGSAQQVPLLKSPLWNCVCCSVLQCVAVCCSVLQGFAVCCSVLWCVADNFSKVRSGVVFTCDPDPFQRLWCSVLQCFAVCCSVPLWRSVLQCVALCCSVQVNLLYTLDTELTFFSVWW